ncbi:hypothetical protein N2152v2_010996 [Parachlorella kessleri]
MALEGAAGRTGPLGDIRAKVAPPGRASGFQPGQLHVLLVDDERLSRTVVGNLLRKCNYQVTTAENGAEAMELLRKSPHGTFQLVLTDICMPEVNGIELLQLVKQDDSFRSVPVIMMSSIEQDETVLQCVQGGADEYLVKPVTKKELQHIWQHVWRKQLASAATVPQVQPGAQQAAEALAVLAPAAAAEHGQRTFNLSGPTAAEALSDAEPLLHVVEPCSVDPAPAAAEVILKAAPCNVPADQLLAAPQVATPVAVPVTALSSQPAAQQLQAQQQAQQQQHVATAMAALPQAQGGAALPLGDFIASPASLEKRLKLFGVAVALLQSCHGHGAPLLRLRPYSLGITPQGLRAVEPPYPSSVQPQQQQQAGLSGDVKLVLDSLYASPEERQQAVGAGRAAAGSSSSGVTLAADLYSLGVLFVDLFLPCASTQERCAQLAALAAGMLPTELAGAGPELAPLRAFVRALLQADPRQRPLVAQLVRSGQLQEVYRLLPLLPCWQARQSRAARKQQQHAMPSCASQQQPAAPLAGSRAAASGLAVQQHQQGQGLAPAAGPAAEGTASAGSAAASCGPGPDADGESLRHFLQLLKESKQAEARVLQNQLESVDADIVHLHASQQDQQAQQAGQEPRSKRQRLAGGPGASGAGSASPQGEVAGLAAPLEQLHQQRPAASIDDAAAAKLDAAMPHLEDLFFARRPARGWSTAQIDSFGEELEVVSRSGGLTVKATLRCGDMASPLEMACCVAFDRDDGLFATVGVSRRIKLFDFGACLAGEPGALHFPVLQMATRSKLSSVSWNAYVASRLVTADYDGLIQLWDVGAGGAELQHFDEHARRVWSVDFSKQDPTRFLSGSDDGTVRLWSMHDESSVLQIKAPANVCSVQFSPGDGHLVAFGCANYKVYAYDLRSPGQPLGTIAGPQRAVSYVRFMGGSHLVAASTDSTLRLWDLRKVLSSGSGSTASGSQSDAPPPECSFRGHRNQRNFVGLSVTPDGYIACGSEDNKVHCYYRSLPFSIGCHQFAAGGPQGLEAAAPAHPPFVSAVAWANRSRHLLAANSQGTIQVLHMD